MGLFVLRTPGWLTWYTKHDHVFAREARRRPRDAALLLPQPRLPRLHPRVDAGLDHPRPARHLHHDQHCRGRDLHGLRRARSPGSSWYRARSWSRWSSSSAAISFRARSWRPAPRRSPTASATRATRSPMPTPFRTSTRRSAPSRSASWSIPGRRVYVRRIDVAGNNKTRDEVIRREMRQLEGAYYDASKIQLSRRRIDRTQFFGEVTVETLPVEGSPDQVDVVYTVKEKPTGALLLGVGFSSVEKIALSALGDAVERVRQRQVHLRQHQQRQREPGVLAVLHGPVLHHRRREPRLRCVQAPHRRVQPGGRPLRHRFARRRRQVRLPGVRADRGRPRRQHRVGRARDLRHQPAVVHRLRPRVRHQVHLRLAQRRLVARYARQPDHHHRRHLPARLERARRRRPLSTTAWATSTSGTSRSRAR